MLETSEIDLWKCQLTINTKMDQKGKNKENCENDHTITDDVNNTQLISTSDCKCKQLQLTPDIRTVGTDSKLACVVLTF